jgi:hypothetical protein
MRGGKILRQFTGTKIPWSKRKNRNAQAQGTLRAWKKLNQMRKAQFRTKSDAATADREEIVVEEIVGAEVSGNAQITSAVIRNEIWCCGAPLCAGTTGALFGEELFSAAQHGIGVP